MALWKYAHVFWLNIDPLSAFDKTGTNKADIRIAQAQHWQKQNISAATKEYFIDDGSIFHDAEFKLKIMI